MLAHVETSYRIGGYDSVSLKPDLGKYERYQSIRKWLDSPKTYRFPENTIETALGQIEEELEIASHGELTPELESKINLCHYVSSELREDNQGRFRTLLENMKQIGLAEVLKDPKTLQNLREEKFHPEVIDILVTKKVLQGFFEILDIKSEDK